MEHDHSLKQSSESDHRKINRVKSKKVTFKVDELTRQIKHLRLPKDIKIISDDSDDNEMKQISQFILNLNCLLKNYRGNIGFLARNEAIITDRIWHELKVGEKLEQLKSKANVVYFFVMRYMKKNIRAMNREMNKVKNEYDDYAEALNKDSFVYYIPILGTYLYNKEKEELLVAIKRIEDKYLKDVRLMLEVLDDIKILMEELDGYYGIVSEPVKNDSNEPVNVNEIESENTDNLNLN